MAHVPAEKLVGEPYSLILAYPRATLTELKKRLRELQKLGITTLEFEGEKQISSLNVMGKGCVGLVVVASKDGEKVALKVRRTDADRASMLREARLLKVANQAGVGPKILKASKNFLVMQFIEGEMLPTWLEGKSTKTRTRRVLRDLLVQCWRLDIAGLDHGELSHAPKHIIIGKNDNATIVDFETASLKRRVANVTSICQFLFIDGVAQEVSRKLGRTSKIAIINALRTYKNNVNHDNFEKVLESCGF